MHFLLYNNSSQLTMLTGGHASVLSVTLTRRVTRLTMTRLHLHWRCLGNRCLHVLLILIVFHDADVVTTR